MNVLDYVTLWAERLGSGDRHDRFAIEVRDRIVGLWEVPRPPSTRRNGDVVEVLISGGSKRLELPARALWYPVDDVLNLLMDGLEDRRGHVMSRMASPALEIGWKVVFPRVGAWSGISGLYDLAIAEDDLVVPGGVPIHEMVEAGRRWPFKRRPAAYFGGAR